MLYVQIQYKHNTSDISLPATHGLKDISAIYDR